jgi:aspartyl-tRNA(Asn)/glutamyl-tRNA(Gln) amidotransferase subunit A
LKAIDRLGELGAVISEVSWPMYRYCTAISSAIQMGEATAYHSHLIRTHGSGIYPPVRLRLEAGFFVSASDYVQAQRARSLFYRESLDLLKKVDLLAGPTVPVTAFEIGRTRVNVGNKTAGAIGLLTQYTRPFNLNGFPAITVPCGFSDAGLPIGLQLAGRPLEEETVLRTADAYERSTDWHHRRPPV